MPFHLCYIKFKTYLTCKFGWKAAGLSCWENFGSEPCSKASRMANNKTIDNNTLYIRRQNICVSSVHRASKIVRFNDGQHRYRSYVKFNKNTVIPVSLASILRPPNAILNQTALLLLKLLSDWLKHRKNKLIFFFKF